MALIQEFWTDASDAAFPHIMKVLETRMLNSPMFEPQLMRKIFEYTLFNKKEHTIPKAAKRGKLKVIEYLCEDDADQEYNGVHSICFASENGHLDIVKFFVENGQMHQFDEEDALYWASRAGKFDVVKYLVDDAGVSADASGSIALGIACKEGRLDVVEFLIKKGANPNALHGYPIWSAAEGGQFEVLSFLAEKTNADFLAFGHQSLFYACREGNLKIAKFLLDRGIRADAANNSALCWAVEHGHLNIVKLLVERGANVLAQNNYPVKTAVTKGHWAILQYLVSQGAIF